MEITEIKDRLFDFALANIKSIEGEAELARPCIDDDTLNAFIENRLVGIGKEREDAEAHIASCPKCRGRVADLMRVIRFPALPRWWLAVAAAVLLLLGTYCILKVTGNLPRGKAKYVAILTEEDLS